MGPPVVLLPGQSAGKKDPLPECDFPTSDEPASSSSGPVAVPGLPVTEGEFPIQQTPLPEPTQEPPVPDADGDSDDTDATVDYREDSLLALAAGDQDVLIRLPKTFNVDPSFVPLDGDGFASWLTKQDKVKAGTVTPAMQQKYAKEIRAAKLEEFKSYLDNDAIRLTDRRKLGRDVNFLTGRWVLTVKVDKNGYFSKFKARWVCRGFQDKFAWDQQTDSPTATRYGFRLVAQCAANHYWDFFHLDLKTAFLQGEHYNLSSRSVVVQLPPDIGLPPWMVGLCLRPVYGLNDAPRRWWTNGGIDWISFSDLLVWNRLVLTDAPMSHTTASKASRTRVTFRREASPLRRNPNQNLLVILRILPFMPCHATHMMKKVGLPPTVRK